MTPEERFERIEADLGATASSLRRSAELQIELKEAMQGVVQIQKRFQELLIEHAEAFEKRAIAAEERSAHLDKTVAAYVASSDASRKRLEESLETLLKAITTEHSNGKKH